MAEENTTIYRKFVQFDGTNWNSWKFRVGVLLDEKNMTKYIEEELDDLLEQTIDDEDEMKCIMEEKKCKSILVQCISDSHLEYVQDKKRAKAMYDSLKAVFERKSVASQLYLRKKLITMNFEESGDMSNHFLAFDKTVRDLKSVGAKLEDLDIVCHLLLSLPESYGNLVTALETLEPEKLTIEFVKSRLLDEYSKRGNVDGIAGSGSSRSVAMYSNIQSIKCYRCNKMGHKSFECSRNVESEKQYGNFASKHDESDDDEVGIAFCSIEHNPFPIKIKSVRNATCNSKQKSIKFYLDSCATSHMVNNPKWLSNITGVKNKKIDVAKNGSSLSADQKGHIEGAVMFNNRKRKCVLRDVLFVKDLRYNLLSIGRMQEAGLEITFKNRKAIIRFKGKMLYVANKRGNLYEFVLNVRNQTNDDKSRKRRWKKPSLSQTNRQPLSDISNVLLTKKDQTIDSKLKNRKLREPMKKFNTDDIQSKNGGSNCKFKRR